MDEVFKYVDNKIDESDKDAERMQRILYLLIINEFIPKFYYRDGALVESKENYALLSELDNVMDSFIKKDYSTALAKMGKSMSDVKNMTYDYYKGQGFELSKLNAVKKKLTYLDSRIGIKGESLIKGSYLDELGKMAEVRTELKTYVLSSINNQSSLKDFQKGFKDMIVGYKDGDKVIDGRLVRYNQQYIHDTWYGVTRATDDKFASGLGLNYFVYEGGLKSTSRPFCIRKNGKAFSRDDAQKWREQNWAGKSEPYDPIQDMGGYNCQHYPRWISKEEYDARKN